MRARYVLIFGRGADRHRIRGIAAGPGFVIAADLPEFLLVTEPDAPVLIGAHSAIVGRVWTSDHRRLDRLDDGLEGMATAKDRRQFPSHYWGNFVLFTEDDLGRSRVYRDPSGAVGAFHLPLAGQDLFFSDVEFAAEFGFPTDPEVDLRFAVHWLQFPFLKTTRTGLTDIVEVVPGAWRYRGDRHWGSQLGWNPADHCVGPGAIVDAGRAAMRLHETATRTIPLQIDAGSPHLQLSGGLDSAVIGACLEHVGVAFEGVHFATSSPDGDERRFARDAASAYGIELGIIIEDELDPPLAAPVAKSMVPGANPILAPIEKAILEHARKHGADLLIDGGGGDNIFCYLATAAPVLDALHDGPRGMARRSAANVAEITHSTWWDVANAAFRLQWQRLIGQSRWREDKSYIAPQMLLRDPEPHPWLSEVAHLPQGKREHVETILQILHFFDRRTDWAMPVLHPLIAQPLLELCLAIPSWMWIEGAQDRAVARAAFADMVPPSILGRRMKGSLQGFIRRSFEKARPALRELLLEGELRRTGILDLKSTERVFAHGWDADAPQLRLSEMASLELWMRSWRS